MKILVMLTISKESSDIQKLIRDLNLPIDSLVEGMESFRKVSLKAFKSSTGALKLLMPKGIKKSIIILPMEREQESNELRRFCESSNVEALILVSPNLKGDLVIIY